MCVCVCVCVYAEADDLIGGGVASWWGLVFPLAWKLFAWIITVTTEGGCVFVCVYVQREDTDTIFVCVLTYKSA